MQRKEKLNCINFFCRLYILFNCILLASCSTSSSNKESIRESLTYSATATYSVIQLEAIDDSDNYENFYNKKPTRINIIHSFLRKNRALGDNEWAFLIQISPDSITETWTWKENLIKQNELDPNFKLNWNYELITVDDVPEWFLPKSLD